MKTYMIIIICIVGAVGAIVYAIKYYIWLIKEERRLKNLVEDERAFSTFLNTEFTLHQTDHSLDEVLKCEKILYSNLPPSEKENKVREILTT